jgi:hypothetical protein
MDIEQGTPQAYFPNTQCDLEAKFAAHHLLFDLTLCGDWAGQDAVYNDVGCPGNCIAHVNEDPAAFADAYWDIKAVRIYQPEWKNDE